LTLSKRLLHLHQGGGGKLAWGEKKLFLKSEKTGQLLTFFRYLTGYAGRAY